MEAPTPLALIPPKKRTWRIVLFVIAVIAIIGYQGWQNWSSHQMLERQVEANIQLQQEKFEQANQAKELNKRLDGFSKHQQLVATVISRDAAADSLMKWLGQRVMIKNDSSIVIVHAVNFGGSRFDHRIWCDVTDQYGNIRQINPELIQAL